MVLRRKSLTIPMLIRSDTYSIRRLWIKSDAIELNAKNHTCYQHGVHKLDITGPNAEIYNGLGYERESSPINIPATIPTITCPKYR